MIYIPVWNRAPNKLIRYEDIPFVLPENAQGEVLEGIETFVIFKDKNGKGQRITAYVKWK